MNALPSYLAVATFGTSASVVQPDGTTYANGYLPGAVLPAQHENWFMNRMTSNENTLMTQVASIQAELNNLLANYSISPDGSTVQIKNLFNGYLGSTSVSSFPFTPPAPIVTPIFLCTTGGGASTFNLPSAASFVGKVLTIIKVDSGAGVVNVTPNGADVIGVFGNTVVPVGSQFQSLKVVSQEAGQWALVNGDSRPNFAHGLTVLTSGTSWTVPNGVTRICVTTIGGGGGGGGGIPYGNYPGGGGGAGGQNKSYVNVTPGASIAYTIGAGGTGVSGGDGTAGGSTTFAGAITSVGGGGGPRGQTPIIMFQGGTGGGGNLGLGGPGFAPPYYSGALGGNGGGAGGMGSFAANVTCPGGNAIGYGGGGGGAGSPGTNQTGGSGYQGAIIIEY